VECSHSARCLLNPHIDIGLGGRVQGDFSFTRHCLDAWQLEDEAKRVRCGDCERLLTSTFLGMPTVKPCPLITLAPPPRMMWEAATDELVLSSDLSKAAIDQLRELLASAVERAHEAVAAGPLESMDEHLVNMSRGDAEVQSQHIIEHIASCLDASMKATDLSIALDKRLSQPGGVEDSSILSLVSSLEEGNKEWFVAVTRLLQLLTRIEPYASLVGERKQAEVASALNGMWSVHERTMDQMLEMTAKGRQEHRKILTLAQARAQGLPGVPSVSFNSPQRRAQAAQLLLNKKRMMDELHETVVNMHLGVGAETRLLVDQLCALPWEKFQLLNNPEWTTADRFEDNMLQCIVFLCSASTLWVSTLDLDAGRCSMDTALDETLKRWEEALNVLFQICRSGLKKHLTPAQVPQLPCETAMLQAEQTELEREWESQRKACAAQAKCSQEEMDRLSALEERLEGQKREVEARGGGSLRPLEEALRAASLSPDPHADVITKRDGQADAEGSRLINLEILLAATRQRQDDTCLRYRAFAAHNYVSRLRLLRRYYFRLRLFQSKPGFRVWRLCGDEKSALAKLKLIMARLLACKLERACDAWQAEQAAHKLLQDEMRETAKKQKNKKKSKKGKKGGQGAAAAAVKGAETEGEGAGQGGGEVEEADDSDGLEGQVRIACHGDSVGLGGHVGHPSPSPSWSVPTDPVLVPVAHSSVQAAEPLAGWVEGETGSAAPALKPKQKGKRARGKKGGQGAGATAAAEEAEDRADGGAGAGGERGHDSEGLEGGQGRRPAWGRHWGAVAGPTELLESQVEPLGRMPSDPASGGQVRPGC
jgi:hypothetical protein